MKVLGTLTLGAALIVCPLLARADIRTTQELQSDLRALQQLEQQQVPADRLAPMRSTLQQMTSDQVNPALFAVDRAIFAAQLEGIRIERDNAQQSQRLASLRRQLQDLQSQSQHLQDEYARLRQQLAQQTATGAQSERLQQEIQQQKQTLRQEQQRLEELSKQAPAAPGAVPSPSVAVPGIPAGLSQYAQISTGKEGVRLRMPVAQLFVPSSHQLTANGLQRLRSVANSLRQSSASEILVRVSPQPEGTNTATRQAESILRALRQNGIPDQRLALASGSGVPAGMAELLLVGLGAQP
ncbi:hypothetical protein [Acidithiobacillus sp.]|uniref:hypothetical protein n=1 Tax=Acidithiobacillus sp. TaxID=1872118 RepID=UPI0025BECCB8|nr:hypothetical protein [Acidithiobacillus sp.]